MFESLSEKISGVFEKLKGKGVIDEKSLNEALREIRVALLEADVSIEIAKEFIEKIKTKALGKEVIKSITPGQMIVKIVNDELVELLGSSNIEINLKAKPPIIMMMVGLQGSGKTTSTAKLAKWLENNKSKKVLMASLDIYRPAAQEQLLLLGNNNKISTLEIQNNKTPIQITKIALAKAKSEHFDILLLDSAGRNHIDQKMMKEVSDISSEIKLTETFLVSDSMTG